MRIELENTVAVLIDVQERLFPHMHEKEALLSKTLTLLGGLSALQVPLIVTEQYPKGLGSTIPEIRQVLEGVESRIGPEPLVKSAFSCCDEPTFDEALGTTDRQTVLIAGIESHVCILQTILDLLEGGYEPVLVVDATSSRSAADKEIALRRIEREGGRLTTVESILFELTRDSRSPRFKEISRLVK